MSNLIELLVPTVLVQIFTVYAVVIAIFIILENRSPQSTFAWCFFFLLVPGLSLLVYFFIGRGNQS